jgi:hypothetical protein
MSSEGAAARMLEKSPIHQPDQRRDAGGGDQVAQPVAGVHVSDLVREHAEQARVEAVALAGQHLQQRIGHDDLAPGRAKAFGPAQPGSACTATCTRGRSSAL